MLRLPTLCACCLLQLLTTHALCAAPVQLACPPDGSPRIAYGVSRLTDALTDAGFEVIADDTDRTAPLISIRMPAGEATENLGPEGFSIQATGPQIEIIGGDDSGVLYGCLELARRVREDGALPDSLGLTERPAFKMRGTCIGLQKPYQLPGRKIYEYPITDELFPFFYDKDFWRGYLDLLVDRRMNMVSLWSGHPFGSLVRPADYPYAVEVSDEQFRRNVEAYRFIAEEADKRGIWITQMFYNILLPAPLAERHHLDTQLKAPTPVAADYTRKAIAEFVRSYPNVGLHVCLGEAMLDVDRQKRWLTEVILPGVKDGMQAAGLREEPPVMIRAHATDPAVVIPAALDAYSNIYTVWKYNGESLTTRQPRGPAQEKHLAMSRLGSMHIVNIHILANLEPFRYGAPRFIKQSTLACRDRLGASGLHVYPLTYWNWPNSPDATDPPLAQTDRDRIWFDAWARYAWDPDVDPQADRRYWTHWLTDRFGSAEAAPLILDAYNDAGECAPRLIRRLGITEGNRQTLSLGMTLDQLVRPEKYGAYPDLWQSQAPPGERLDEYVRREWEGLPHEGETPPKALAEALRFADNAVASLEKAAPLVTKNREEFDRLLNDARSIRAMTRHYAAKTEAARLVLRHGFSNDPDDLRQAADYLAESVEHYRELTQLTDDAYQFANSMQIAHRRIPYRGADAKDRPINYHWRQVLPLFEKELEDFRASLKQETGDRSQETGVPEIPPEIH